MLEAVARPTTPPRADPILLAAVGLAVGILLADLIGPTGRFWPLLGSGLATLAVCGLLLWKRPRLTAKPGRGRLAALIPCLALLLPGLLRGRSLHPPTLHPPGLLARTDVLATVEGSLQTALMPAPREVRGSDDDRQARTSFRLEKLIVDGGLGPSAHSGAMLVLLPASGRFLPRGTRVRITGHIRAPAGPRNPGQDDPRKRHRRNGIRWLLALDDERGILELEPAPAGSPSAGIDRLRAGLLERLRERLSPLAAALSAALLLGTRGDLEPALRDAIRDTGTLHLFAISGLHVALVIGSSRALIGVLLGPTLADLLAIALALAYAAVAGAGSPILRAATGCAVFFLGRCLHRRPRPFTSLSLAAILLLLHDPGELFRPGFQLSFAAVAGLLLSGFPRRRRGILGWVVSAAMLSICATLATAPLLVHHFGRFTPLGPLLTLLVTPLFLASFTVILAHGLATAARVPFEQMLAPLVEVACQALACFFRLAAELVGGATAWPRPDGWITGGLLAVSGLLLRRRIVPALLLLSCVLLFASPGRRFRGPLEFWVFDVGHGQAVLLRSPDGRTLMFDCGSRGRPEIGRRTLLPALDHLGVHLIDTMVLSHSDADHLNGAADLIEAGRVGRLIQGRPGGLGVRERAVLDASDRRGISREPAHRGTLLFEGPELRVELLAPASFGPAMSDNDDSLVLLATFAGRSILIPGDIESAGIRNLLELEPDLRCDVLLLPHHGNPQPLLSPLIHRTRPQVVLASRPARFGTPLVPRLARRAGALLMTTAESGAILVRIRTDGTIHAEGFLETPTERSVTESQESR